MAKGVDCSNPRRLPSAAGFGAQLQANIFDMAVV
jgi:hypothetical protein